VIVTVEAALLTCPSLTTRLATYVPAWSAVKVGAAELAPVNAAELPAGLDTSVHAYVSGSLLASELALPFSVTMLPVITFCAAPALATGARLVAGGEGAAGGGETDSLPPPPPQAASTRVNTAINFLVSFNSCSPMGIRIRSHIL
jgi:hypothetical protein